MVLVNPFFLWGFLFTIIIFCVHNIVKYTLIKNLDFGEKIKILFGDVSLEMVIKYFIGGFAAETGKNFLAIIFSHPSQSFPITLVIQESEFPFIILGVAIMIGYPLYDIFFKEFLLLKKSKTVSNEMIKENLINFCYEYASYIKNTNNPKLSVMKFQNENTILVNSHQGTKYFTKNLKFSLYFQEVIDVGGIQTSIDSLEIADCYFLKSGDKHAYFIISNWNENSSNKEQIEKIKTNQDFKILKPFVRLSENEIAEKFSYPEMKNYMKTNQKIKLINEVS